MGNLTPAQATVISAIISGIVAVIVCVINSRAQQRKMLIEFEERDAEKRKAEAVRDAKLEMWMKGVEEKLDLHNGYAQKLGEIQTDIAVIKNDIKTLYKQA
jgi:hypothetical protein